MKPFQVETIIDAPVPEVWGVLVDTEAWPTWESGVLRVEGHPSPGSKLRVVSEANPKRAFALRVTEMESPTTMVWTGGMPLGLFRGVRKFHLAAQGDASSFTMREDYSGPLVALISKSMPDLQPSFEKFARGLKARAEQETRRVP